MKNLFILLFGWVLICFLFLVRIPFAMFIGMVKGLCRSLQEINEDILPTGKYPALLIWLCLILFMLFPIFMIPFVWFCFYTAHEDLKWSDILPFRK